MRIWIFLIAFFSFSALAEEDIDCDKAWTTLEINQCMYKELVGAEKVLDKYLVKSLERYLEDDVSLASIKKVKKLGSIIEKSTAARFMTHGATGLSEQR
ncbi:lysozyme inhibitor LprI family protein [Pseudoalteromonas xiamenensis]